MVILNNKFKFNDVSPGDIIAFQRVGTEQMIMHRVISIIHEKPYTLKAQGDANLYPIPNIDYPITEKDYIGKMIFIIPDVEFISFFLKPPVNYIWISFVIFGLIIYIRKSIIKTISQNS